MVRTRTGRRAGHVAAALVVLAVIVIVVVSRRGESASPSLVDPATLRGESLAWTGEGLLVFGGTPPEGGSRLAESATLVDVASGDIEALPLPPFPVGFFGAALVAVDDTVVLVAGRCDDAESEEEDCPPGTYVSATLSLEERSWTEVEIPDALASTVGLYDAVGATSDGHAVFRLGTRRDAEYWTYSVADRVWAEVPSPGVRLDDACLAGDRLVVVNATLRSLEDVAPGEPYDHWEAVTLHVRDLADPDGEWQATPPNRTFRVPGRGLRPEVECTSEAVLVRDDDERHARRILEPDSIDDPWPETADPPELEFLPATIEAGNEIVFLGTDDGPLTAASPTRAYDPVLDRWRVLVGAPVGAEPLVWTGDSLVGYRPPGGPGAPTRTILVVHPIPAP